MEILALAIRDALAGRKTRARRMREMARALRAAWWTDAKVKLDARLTRAERSARIWKAVRSAALVIEPARYIHACRPEWIALEQVPAVLPLWQAYATELRKLGYSVWVGKLNAADFGVPQTRVRAILIASRVRKVTVPEPTHYDPRKGDQLWGEHWVSMAEALGIGATGRPAPSVTAGGTSTGGAEPFARGGRGALEAERDAGRWVLRMDTQAHASVRDVTAPAPALKIGHSAADCQWVLLHTNRDQRPDGTRQTADPHTAPAPAPALTSKSGGQWELHRSRGASVSRRDHPADEPAPTITGAGGKPGGNLTWKLRNNNNNNNACERSTDEPAGTLFFGQRSNWAAWVTERPATTVQGDPRIGRPGHKGPESGGESQFAVDSVRITVTEAAVLQSFRPDYPFQGTKSARFRQVGDAWCPLAAIAVVGVATGIDWRPVAEKYTESCREQAA
jgi:DNA (cytosine-5)-methyltransferase 1